MTRQRGRIQPHTADAASAQSGFYRLLRSTAVGDWRAEHDRHELQAFVTDNKIKSLRSQPARRLLTLKAA